MKKIVLFSLLTFGITLTFPTNAFAQGMMGNVSGENDSTVSEDAGHTAQGEAEGRVIWERLQAKELNCGDLSDDDFHSLGMHFMGQMAGDSHEAMDTMMEQMMSEEGEDQMHVVMGKRMSGCDPDEPVPQNMMGGSMMGMMQMMGGSTNSTPMMGNWEQGPLAWFGFGSWLIMLTLMVWLIVGVLAILWLWKQLRKK